MSNPLITPVTRSNFELDRGNTCPFRRVHPLQRAQIVVLHADVEELADAHAVTAGLDGVLGHAQRLQVQGGACPPAPAPSHRDSARSS